jgi:hypothetical protein
MEEKKSVKRGYWEHKNDQEIFSRKKGWDVVERN